MCIEILQGQEVNKSEAFTGKGSISITEIKDEESQLVNPRLGKKKPCRLLRF